MLKLLSVILDTQGSYVGCMVGTMVCGDTDERSLDAMISSVLAFKFSHSDECQMSVICSVGSTAVC